MLVAGDLPGYMPDGLFPLYKAAGSAGGLDGCRARPFVEEAGTVVNRWAAKCNMPHERHAQRQGRASIRAVSGAAGGGRPGSPVARGGGARGFVRANPLPLLVVAAGASRGMKGPSAENEHRAQAAGERLCPSGGGASSCPAVTAGRTGPDGDRGPGARSRPSGLRTAPKMCHLAGARFLARLDNRRTLSKGTGFTMRRGSLHPLLSPASSPPLPPRGSPRELHEVLVRAARDAVEVAPRVEARARGVRRECPDAGVGGADARVPLRIQYARGRVDRGE